MAYYGNLVDNFANQGGFPDLGPGPNGVGPRRQNRRGMGLGQGFSRLLYGINPFRDATFMGRRLFQPPNPQPYGPITASAYGSTPTEYPVGTNLGHRPQPEAMLGNGFTPARRATRRGY
jgi:hypothetical protein